MFTVKVIPNKKGNPPGKLADVELHFTDIEQDCPACQGAGERSIAGATDCCAVCHGRRTMLSPFGGLKLIGFAIWERRGGNRNVTFPARQYSVNGERRSFALLRPVVGVTAQACIRDLILDAFDQREQNAVAERGVVR
jgi:hypothetical protein